MAHPSRDSGRQLGLGLEGEGCGPSPYARCVGCPYPERPIVKGFGPKLAPTIIGEAPGETEAREGRPFVGLSGKLLWAVLREMGLTRDDVYVTNAVICHPPNNKTPTPTMLRGCRRRLFAELREAQSTKILTVGGPAWSAVVGSRRILPITKERGRGCYVNLELEGLDDVGVYTVPTLHPASVLRKTGYFRDLVDDIEKWLTNSQPYAVPDISPIIPSSPSEALQVMDLLRSATELACDLETTGFDPLSDDIISIGLGALYDDGSDDGLWLIIPFTSNRVIKDTLVDMLEGVTWGGRWVFHNLKFDLQFLNKWAGRSLRPANVRDTMLLHHCLDERAFSDFNVHGLKDLARFHFDMEDFSVDFDDVSDEDLFEYQALDLWATIKLSSLLESEALCESPALLNVHDNVLIPASIALAEAELTGVEVDTVYLRDIKKSLEDEIGELDEFIMSVAREYNMPDFNPNSHSQLAELLYDKIGVPEIDGRSVREEVLQKVSGDASELAQAILELRSSRKLMSTHLDSILEKIGPDGRVHTDLLLHGTSTGRLSSANPNLQNMPKFGDVDVRSGLVAEDGWYFVSIDYSQLELRVAAWLSADEKMLEIYQKGEDFHSTVASQLFNKPVEDITYIERGMAKTINFGIIYGRGPYSIAHGPEMRHLESLGGDPWTVREAEAYIDRFLSQFPALRKWINYQKAFVHEHGYVETMFGRRRRFPFIPKDASRVERQAANTPIQSMASDLNLLALVRIHQADLDGVRILFPVHDEIDFEIRRDVLWRRVWEIVTIMEDIDAPVPFRVDVEVDLSQPSRWGSGEEIERNALIDRCAREIHDLSR